MTFSASFSSQFTTDDPLEFRRHLLKQYLPYEGLRANLVISPDGATTDETGSSRGVSSDEDHQLLLALREISDVVIVSARTAEIEKYSASKLTRVAIVQGSNPLGDIPALRDTRAEAKPVLLICHVSQMSQNQHLLENPNVQLVDVNSGLPGNLGLEEIIEKLQALGLQRQLLEAGVTLDAEFLRLKLIGRFCLSTVSESKQDFQLHSDLLTSLGSGAHIQLISWRSPNGLFTEWECVR